LVRPHIEDCSQIWSLHCDNDINLIESAQRRATKQGLKYNETLNQLGLVRLERQRVRSDLIETFKIINEKYDSDRDLFFQLDKGGRKGRNRNC